MDHKILLVDDEQNILDGLQRLLRKEFNIETACGGEAGLNAIASSGPYAVAMSDMRMPGMNGIQFLTKLRERSPETVRLMLTGNSDIQTAMDAVNEGCVFRFLTKPCPDEILKGALHAAIVQHELITAEKELLEKTLHGSVKVLTEILALVSPAAFSKASRVHHIVQHLARQLALPDPWRYELAAMLSQVGCVALDPETVEAVYAGAEIRPEELKRFNTHPSIAYELLNKIPRLDIVAKMIAGQQSPPAAKGPLPAGAAVDAGEMGAQLLKIAVDLDELILRGATSKDAREKLKSRPADYYPAAVATLESLPSEDVAMVVQEITIREMATGMILDDDLRSPTELVMVARNTKISYPLLVRIRNLCEKTPLTHKIRVKVPQHVAPSDVELKDQAVVQTGR